MKAGDQMRVVFAVMAIGTAGASADPYAAKMYDLSAPDTLLFTSTRTETEKPGSEGPRREVKITFTNPDGSLAMEENVVLDGERLVTYRMTQNQLGESGGVDVVGGEAKLYYVKANGKRAEDHEKFVPELMVSATTIFYLKKNWAKVMAGGTVDIRFVAIDRTETFGFQFKKVREATRADGTPTVELELKPTSFIIAAMVKPIVFIMDAKKVRILETRGRIMPKKKVGNDWKDAEVRAVYEYASG